MILASNKTGLSPGEFKIDKYFLNYSVNGEKVYRQNDPRITALGSGYVSRSANTSALVHELPDKLEHHINFGFIFVGISI
jgi:hypothetical protein